MEEKNTRKNTVEEEEVFMRQLKEADMDTLPHRAKRKQELASLIIPQVPTLRVFDYFAEAEKSYVNGCYRSCIICSSNAVEQSLIHKLITSSEDWEKTYWEIRMEKNTFGKIIEKIERKSKKNKKLKTLAGCLRDAKWLNRIRNEVAVHATYIPDYSELRQTDLVIANRIILRDIRHLLQFFNPQKRRQFEKEPLTAKDSQGKILGKSEPLGEFLKNPMKIDSANYFEWWGFQKGLLHQLALEAYERMAIVINGLYSKE